MAQQYEAVRNFPRRTLSVKMKWTEIVASAFVGIVVVGMVGFAVFLLFETYGGTTRDSAVFQNGVETYGSVDGGSCVINVVLISDCNIDISYEGRNGSTRQAHLSGLFMSGLKDGSRLVFKYDSDDDTRVTVSWFANHIGERWIVTACVSIGSLLLALLLISQMIRVLKTVRTFRKLAAYPNPVACRIVDMEERQSPNYEHRYVFEYDFSGEARRAEQIFAVILSYGNENPRDFKYRHPIFLDAVGSVALGLMSADGDALLVPDNFAPLVLFEDEKASVQRGAQIDRSR